MRYVALVTLLGTICFAGESTKPVCNSKSHGQFWPLDANVSQVAAQRLYAQGQLEMCSLVVWKYKWERLSVNVHEAAQGKHPALSTTDADKAGRASLAPQSGR
jgi:hypothetical protein